MADGHDEELVPREPARFREDTEPVPLGDGTWRVEVSPRWAVLGGGTNGGYLTSAVTRAAVAATPGHHDPATVTTHYLRPASPGPARVAVDVLAAGRRFSRWRATLEQDGAVVAEVLGASCDLDAFDGPDAGTATPPALPPRGDCIDPTHGEAARMGSIRDRLDIRVAAGTQLVPEAGPDGTGSLAAWVRWAGAEPMTSAGLLTLVDAMPPAAFHLAGVVGWTPTVELTTHVRRRPVPGWLRIAWRTRSVTGGLLEEDTEVWDADGNLVALSRQLALAARPASPPPTGRTS